MKNLYGYSDAVENRLNNIVDGFDGCSNEEIMTKIGEILKLGDNFDCEQLNTISVKDIVPGLIEYLFGIPAELMIKPICEISEEEEALIDEAFLNAITIFTSNK